VCGAIALERGVASARPPTSASGRRKRRCRTTGLASGGRCDHTCNHREHARRLGRASRLPHPRDRGYKAARYDRASRGADNLGIATQEGGFGHRAAAAPQWREAGRYGDPMRLTAQARAGARRSADEGTVATGGERALAVSTVSGRMWGTRTRIYGSWRWLVGIAGAEDAEHCSGDVIRPCDGSRRGRCWSRSSSGDSRICGSHGAVGPREEIGAGGAAAFHRLGARSNRRTRRIRWTHRAVGEPDAGRAQSERGGGAGRRDPNRAPTFSDQRDGAGSRMKAGRAAADC